MKIKNGDIFYREDTNKLYVVDNNKVYWYSEYFNEWLISSLFKTSREYSNKRYNLEKL